MSRIYWKISQSHRSVVWGHPRSRNWLGKHAGYIFFYRKSPVVGDSRWQFWMSVYSWWYEDCRWCVSRGVGREDVVHESAQLAREFITRWFGWDKSELIVTSPNWKFSTAYIIWRRNDRWLCGVGCSKPLFLISALFGLFTTYHMSLRHTRPQDTPRSILQYQELSCFKVGCDKNHALKACSRCRRVKCVTARW